jgi:hypothetical protein
MGDRKAATDFIVANVTKLVPGSPYIAMLTADLEKLTDAEFDALMESYAQGTDVVPLQVPNGAPQRLNIDRNLALAAELGHDFFQHLVITDPQTGTTYQTPKKYLVVDLPVRRQIQMLTKKQSIPENNLHIDQLTDQPTGASKGAAISFPELQVLAAQQADASLRELISFRGGDRKAYNYMTKLIVQEGGANHKTLGMLNSRVKSTAVLSSFFKGMHLDNNL